MKEPHSASRHLRIPATDHEGDVQKAKSSSKTHPTNLPSWSCNVGAKSLGSQFSLSLARIQHSAPHSQVALSYWTLEMPTQLLVYKIRTRSSRLLYSPTYRDEEKRFMWRFFFPCCLLLTSYTVHYSIPLKIHCHQCHLESVHCRYGLPFFARVLVFILHFTYFQLRHLTASQGFIIPCMSRPRGQPRWEMKDKPLYSTLAGRVFSIRWRQRCPVPFFLVLLFVLPVPLLRLLFAHLFRFRALGRFRSEVKI